LGAVLGLVVIGVRGKPSLLLIERVEKFLKQLLCRLDLLLSVLSSHYLRITALLLLFFLLTRNSCLAPNARTAHTAASIFLVESFDSLRIEIESNLVGCLRALRTCVRNAGSPL